MNDGSTETEQKRITAWCNAHGLLGILPHCTSIVRLAPRVEKVKLSGRPEPELRSVQRELVRQRISWKSTIRFVDLKDRGFAQGQLVPESKWFKYFEPSAAFVLQVGTRPSDLRTGGGTSWLWRELGDAWAHFFPDMPYRGENTALGDDYQYPVPLTGEFWREYAEPIWEFLKWANILKQALIDDAAAGPNLAILLDSVGPVFVPKRRDGNPERAWASHSLLGAYAMMAYLDLTSGGRPVVCGMCSKAFLSTRQTAKYCSFRCLKTAEKRNQRSRANIANSNP
jgi:hypothetical protein